MQVSIKDVIVGLILFFVVGIICMGLFLGCEIGEAETVAGYDVDKLADSIFLAEGGYKADFLYGIRSIPYETEEQARRYCKNTIKNQYKRYLSEDNDVTYIVSLRNRYAPLNAKNDSQGLNENWLRLVLYFYNKT